MASVDEDFPRGGTSKKTTESKVKPVRQHTEVDNLFQEHEPAESLKRKGPKKDEGKKVVKKQKRSQEEALKLNATPSVEILHLKDVKVGSLLLGCVKEVTEFEVIVSLPSGLRGYLALSNISESFTKLLSAQLSSEDVEEICSLRDLIHPGMLLRCAVARLDMKKEGVVSIHLSINPSEVNKGLSTGSLKAGMVLSGCVESIEDHGYLVEIGVSGTKAFLPKQAATDKSNSPKELKVGEYITSVLEDVKDDGRVVRLSTSPSAVGPACADIRHGWTLTSLLPGLIVKAQIKKVTSHGLIMEFLSSFSGLVDFLHVEAGASYKEGDEVKACVLYVEPSTRLVGLSLRGHLLQPGRALELVASERIGEVLKGCKVISLHQKSGAILELPDKTLAFVHKNNLKETGETLNLNRFIAEPEHTCRVMDYNYMEQMRGVSLRKSIIDAPLFRYHDLQPGQIVHGTVLSLETFGMIVKLTNTIRGVVPKEHLCDIILTNPEKKYTAGMRVKCRVLSVEPQLKKLSLTRKQALIDSTLPLFLSYADARRGRISHGYIVCVKEFGCIVGFYGGVRGLVRVQELSAEPVIVPQTMFYVGQVVKAKVLTCDPEKEKLQLSFKAVVEGDTEATNEQQFDFEIGKKVEARVLSKTPGGLKVAILPEETHALLPTSHLSDHVSNCPLLWEALQEGDTVSNLFCLSKNKQDIILTKKPVLRWALEEELVTKDFSDLQKGTQMIGWIRNVMTFGVFVKFPSDLVGLAPKAEMSDKFISDTTGVFQPGQTVAAKVIDLDEDKRRFVVTLKASEVAAPGGDAQARLVQGLRERRAVANMLARRDDSEVRQQLSAVTVGQKFKLTVDEVKEDKSVSLKSDELKGSTILATRQHCLGLEVTSGQKVKAAVLHVDLLTSQVHVTLRPELVVKKKSVEEGSRHTATVQHVDRDFAVVSLGDTAQLTVIQTSNHLNDTFRYQSEKLTPGKTLSATVTEASCEALGGLPLVSWHLKAQPKRERKTSDAAAATTGANGRSPSIAGAYRCGDMVEGTVKVVKPTCVLVALEGGVTGRVHVSEVQDSACLGTFPTSYLKTGSKVTARVIGGREESNRSTLPISHPKFACRVPELTLMPSKLEEDVVLEPFNLKDKLNSYKVGDDIVCFVSKYNVENRCLELTINHSLNGTVELLDMITDLKNAKHPEKLFKQGQAVSAKVTKVSPKRISLSLAGVRTLVKGSVTLGMVENIEPDLGLLVKLQGVMGTVDVLDLADSYKMKPLQSYSKGQLIRCSLVEEKEGGNWHLSLRPSRLDPEKATAVKDPEVLSLGDLKTGQIIRGYVKSVGKEGVFIRLSRSITGRAQLQQTTRYFVADHRVYVTNIPVNTLLTTKILSVEESGHVSLSLLPEDTGKPDVLPESLGLPLKLVGEEKENHDAKKKKKTTTKRKLAPSESQQSSQEQAEKVPKKKRSKLKTEESSGVEVYFREEEEEGKMEPAKPPPQVKSAPTKERLQVSGGFSWDTALSTLKPASTAVGGGDSSGGEEEEEQQSKPQKKSRQEQEAEKQQAEKSLVRLETELMDPGLRPQDAGSFERLLLASPDSSLLWMQYMTFHLQATQIEQARAVAERALKTISFREEQEKLNVWVALLNLENLYGTEDSLKAAFQRALQFCEPMPVYQQLADIYAKSGKTKEAENLYKLMVNRFRTEKAVWLSYGSFLLQQGQGDAASSVLQRALRGLTAKENVDMIAKFAQLEFRFGDAEKAKSMLDKVLTSYPKRTDLWCVFIDLMVKHGSQKEVRALFDRVIHLSVAVKKIKLFFKRYLEYEKKNGTPESVQVVKEKALEYVEAKGTTEAN